MKVAKRFEKFVPKEKRFYHNEPKKPQIKASFKFLKEVTKNENFSLKNYNILLNLNS